MQVNEAQKKNKQTNKQKVVYWQQN